MEVYFYSIVLSLIMIYFINRLSPSKSGGVYWVLSILSLLPTTIVAGIRDLTIGTDIQHYVTTNFLAAREYSKLFEFVDFIQNTKTAFVGSVNHTESGYSVLTYLVSRYTEDVHWLLFTLQFLTIISVYIGLVNFSKNLKINISMGMFIYYFVFYGPSLNIMRQTLAASIVFLGMSYLAQNKLKTSIMMILLASFFHLSAMIALFSVIIYKIIAYKNNPNSSYIIQFSRITTLLLIFGVMYVMGEKVFNALQNIVSLIPFLSKYSASFEIQSGYGFLGTISFFISDFIIVGLASIYENKDEKNSVLNKFFFINICLTVFLFTIYKYQTVIPRLAIYFSIMRIVSYPYFIKQEKNTVIKIVMVIIMVIVLITFFVITTKSGSGGIYPYTSQILEGY